MCLARREIDHFTTGLFVSVSEALKPKQKQYVGVLSWDKMPWPFCQLDFKKPYLPSNSSGKTLFKHEGECAGNLAERQHRGAVRLGLPCVHLIESDAEIMTDQWPFQIESPDSFLGDGWSVLHTSKSPYVGGRC